MSKSSRISRYRWWRKLKEKVKKRDNYTCRICPSTENLRVCHIWTRRNYPEKERKMWNCLTLCGYCDCKYGERLLDPDVEILWNKLRKPFFIGVDN